MQSTIGRKYGNLISQPDIRNFAAKDHFEIFQKHDDKILTLQEFAAPHIDQLQVGLCGGAGGSRALKTFLNFVKYKWPFTPSALATYFYARKIGGNGPTEDSGVEIVNVFKAWNQYGVIPEDSNKDWSWPFSASDNRWQLEPPPKARDDGKTHILLRWMQVGQTENEILSVLKQGRPILTGTVIYSGFESDKVANDGVVWYPKADEQVMGGHCTYYKTAGAYKSGYLDGANSWGSNWGDKGDFHMPIDMVLDPQITTDLYTFDLATSMT